MYKMNERAKEQIKELAIEAGFYANPDVEKFVKFAQLVARECAEICLEANDHENILRVFGVEE